MLAGPEQLLRGGENLLGRPIEFGWLEVRPTEAGRKDPVIAALGGGVPTFHWHVDTVSLPPGAVHLATSAQTDVQAFRIGRAVYGIQFHFEADRGVVEAWNRHFRDEIAAYAPDWPDRHAVEAARHSAVARAAAEDSTRADVRTAQGSMEICRATRVRPSLAGSTRPRMRPPASSGIAK